MNGSPLASYAACPSHSRGRYHSEPAPNYRTEYQRDRDRIVHSAAFRRLEYKTQVFVNHEGDLYRTRLTHSIEVAQIGRSIARALNLNEDLVEAIALAHDLGHTPFGHAGQEALNQCMADYGGFEHNLQSLRVVDELEEKYAEFSGLNLTYETREGILKHCSKENAKQLGAIGLRFLNKEQASLEAQLTDLADAITYNNHDVDDGLRAGLITIEQLNEVPFFSEQYSIVKKSYPDLPKRRSIHETVRRMINRQITDLITTSTALIHSANPETVDDIRAQSHSLIKFSDAMAEQHHALKQFLRQHLYQHYKVYRETIKAQQIVHALFKAFMDHPRLLPQEHYNTLNKIQKHFGETGRARTIADYIAGMTDRFAITEFDKLFP